MKKREREIGPENRPFEKLWDREKFFWLSGQCMFMNTWQHSPVFKS
jgi:hypothetical protein